MCCSFFNRKYKFCGFLKVWKYNEGEVIAIGFGHGGEVKRVRICPNNEYIVSVGEDGSILRWRLP